MSNQASTSRRQDGRQPTELRPLHASIGHLDRADGSGKFGFGSTAALASFSGPMEVRLREEMIDRATLEIVHRPLEGVGATPSRALVSSLQTLLPPLLQLTHHPRSLVQLIIQSLSPSIPPQKSSDPWTIDTDPNSETEKPTDSWPQEVFPTPSNSNTSPTSGLSVSSKAASINASTLAILDAGSISLTGIPIAISLAYIPMINQDKVLVIDPTAEEEENSSSRYGFAWAFGVDFGKVEKEITGGGGMDVDGSEGLVGQLGSELIWVESEGDFTRNEFHEAMTQSREAAQWILEFIKDKMEDTLKSKTL